MKTAAIAIALLGLLPSTFAQTLAASPTESYGCEPHGDHYHCEGARATLSTVVTSAAAAATTEAHDHDEDDHDEDEHTDASGTGTLAASPTESYGCEPHGDHYHCEGARATLSTVVSQAAAATTTEAHDHDDHDDETGTGSAAASPTESYGCEAHGDHWHCDGARATTGGSDSTPAASDSTAAASNSTPTASGNAVTATGAAGMEMVPILGMVAAAVLAL
ncbi:hypothetical protein BKA56DRAFT_681269 [Ilyonectria sp. MPI-CAGE-AT-0026]|nr:hypothetical protein BKA56DRAFT_681269 [Ilyonectria sp. MPI-CAGE-AT-0026]